MQKDVGGHGDIGMRRRSAGPWWDKGIGGDTKGGHRGDFVEDGGHRGECGGGGDLEVTQGDAGRTDLVVAVDGDGRGLDQAHPEPLVGLEGETLLGLVRDLGTRTQGGR